MDPVLVRDVQPAPLPRMDAIPLAGRQRLLEHGANPGLVLGAGVTPAPGGVEPGQGFTFNKVILSELRWNRSTPHAVADHTNEANQDGAHRCDRGNLDRGKRPDCSITNPREYCSPAGNTLKGLALRG